MATIDPPTGVMALMRKGVPFVAPLRGKLAASLTLALALAGIQALEPLALKYIFDGLAGPAAMRAVLIGIICLVALMLGRELFAGWLDVTSWHVRIGVNFRLTRATVERLHTLPLSFHTEQSVGGLMTKMDRGIVGSVNAFSDLAFNVFPALVYFGVAVAIMVRLDWRLSLVVLAFAPIAPLIGTWAAGEQTRRERSLMDRWTRLYARFNEVLAGILVVKTFAMEEREKRRFLDGVEGANATVLRGVRRDACTNASKNAAVTLARIVAVAWGGVLAANGKLSIGTLVAFLGYLGAVFGPVQGLTGTYQTLRRGTVALQTIFSILDAQDTLGDAPDARDPGPLRGEVQFERVSFGYDRDQPVVTGIELVAQPGQTIALVGASGAGKSTVMSLLQRLYDPTEGRILLDGQDVRALKQRKVREQIGTVLQDNVLFSDSVRDNIVFGRPGASEQAIVQAAMDAHAHEFIVRLPQGYDTEVGDRGCRLSVGQRQRVAIARALLKNPAILILDEPTSALDAESEALVQQALGRLKRGRTTFVIAHRLATVADADRILVFHQGKIVERGTHQELIALGGVYASMVRRQMLRPGGPDPSVALPPGIANYWSEGAGGAQPVSGPAHACG